MAGTNKPIQLSNHAKDQLHYRGATISEIEETIRNSPWNPAELGRLECRKDFTYGNIWNGRMYGTKQVKPIFVEEGNNIVVVTVYVYYF